MAIIQQKIIPTITTLTVNGNDIDIYTFYDENGDALPNTIWVEIMSVDGIVDGVQYKQGEAVLKLKNYPEDIYYYIDNNGEVVVVADDAVAYYIDTDDQLTYDENLIPSLEDANLPVNVPFNL